MRELVSRFEIQHPDAFPGDAVSLLQCIYRDQSLPLDVRIDAAGKAARFERPTLAAVAVREMPKVRPDLSALSSAEQVMLATMLRRVLPTARFADASSRVEIEGEVE